MNFFCQIVIRMNEQLVFFKFEMKESMYFQCKTTDNRMAVNLIYVGNKFSDCGFHLHTRILFQFLVPMPIALPFQFVLLVMAVDQIIPMNSNKKILTIKPNDFFVLGNSIN